MHPPKHVGSIAAAIAATLIIISPIYAVDPPPDGGYPNQNTAEGADALFSLTSGVVNTAIGFNALYSDTDGGGNTAIGYIALYSNTYGGGNTAIGIQTLHSNTGSFSTAIGGDVLYNNTSGSDNTGIGYLALLNNTTGSSNIALGQSAGSSLTTGKNNIDIGNAGKAGESAKIRIGNTAHKNTYIAGISGVTVAGGVSVIVDTSGHLGTVTSSARYKETIRPMDKASEVILSLNPVQFRYKKELDPTGVPQFGLVAEDVAKIDPDLVAKDEEGKPYTVRYEAVNAMLLNEFIKEHEQITALRESVANQNEEIAELRAAVTNLKKNRKERR